MFSRALAVSFQSIVCNQQQQVQPTTTATQSEIKKLVEIDHTMEIQNRSLSSKRASTFILVHSHTQTHIQPTIKNVSKFSLNV